MKKWRDASKLAGWVRGLLDCTDWGVIEAAASDLNEPTDTVTSYIKFCEDMWAQTKTFCTYNNSKPCSSGDQAQYNHAGISQTKEIRVAKNSYTEKLRSSLW